MALYPVTIRETDSLHTVGVVLELGTDKAWCLVDAAAMAIHLYTNLLRAEDESPVALQPVVDWIDHLANIIYSFAEQVVASQTHDGARSTKLRVTDRNKVTVLNIVTALERAEAMYEAGGISPARCAQVKLPHWHPNFREFNDRLHALSEAAV